MVTHSGNPATRRLRHDKCEFEASLGYIARLSQNKQVNVFLLKLVRQQSLRDRPPKDGVLAPQAPELLLPMAGQSQQSPIGPMACFQNPLYFTRQPMVQLRVQIDTLEI